jgi:hypothetical protein
MEKTFLTNVAGAIMGRKMNLSQNQKPVQKI